MRILLLLSLSLILTNTATSQINKGHFLVGGNINFESVKIDGDGVYITSYKTTTFFVSPNIGYFIIPKLAGGLRLNIGVYKQSSAVYSQTNISLSPFLRYYLLSQKQKFNILVDASYINMKSKTRIQGNPTPVIERTTGYNITVGPSLFLNQHVALEFLLSYKQTQLKDISDNKNSAVNAVLGLQIHLGKIKTKGKV